MAWTRNIGVAIIALVLLGLIGIWLSAPRLINADVPPDHLLTPWAAHLDEVEAGLAGGDRARAVRAWGNAWIAAQASHHWQPLLDVGDAARRLGEVTDSAATGRAKARRAYRAALVRAHAQRSVDGVLRAAECFAALGDRDVTEGALHTARKLAARTPDLGLRARVEVDAERIAARVVTQ
jgi:hypothetical protein